MYMRESGHNDADRSSSGNTKHPTKWFFLAFFFFRLSFVSPLTLRQVGYCVAFDSVLKKAAHVYVWIWRGIDKTQQNCSCSVVFYAHASDTPIPKRRRGWFDCIVVLVGRRCRLSNRTSAHLFDLIQHAENEPNSPLDTHGCFATHRLWLDRVRCFRMLSLFWIYYNLLSLYYRIFVMVLRVAVLLMMMMAVMINVTCSHNLPWGSWIALDH